MKILLVKGKLFHHEFSRHSKESNPIQSNLWTTKKQIQLCEREEDLRLGPPVFQSRSNYVKRWGHFAFAWKKEYTAVLLS